MRGAAAIVAVGGGAARAEAQKTQITGSMDVGGATVAYDEFVRAAVGTISPMLRVEHGRATVVARGAYSRFESGNQSLESTLAVSVISPALHSIRGEFFGTASNTRYSRLSDAATNVLVVGRVHLANASRGAWLGTGFGAVSQGFFLPDNLFQVDAGAWLRAGEGTFTAQVQPTRIGSLHYTDAIASARWEPTRTQLSASAGVRAGDHATGVTRWAEVGAAFWFSRHVAMVGGGGVFPAELWRGLPGGRYASAALRLSTHPPREADPQRLAELTLPYELGRLRRPAAAAQQFAVVTETDGTRTILLRVTGASSVELMGDFTDWLPVRLSPAGRDRWAMNVFLAPGVHRVNVRLDGGSWIAPPGLTVVRDDFGGEVGLLIVQ